MALGNDVFTVSSSADCGKFSSTTERFHSSAAKSTFIKAGLEKYRKKCFSCFMFAYVL